MTPDLDVKHLALVEAVAEEGTVTGGAGRLFITQSSASERLKEAEERLGAALFERHGRGMRLTLAGERVLEAARAVLSEMGRAEADVRALAAGRAGTLRVATECYTTYHWLPDALRSFAQRYPQVDVEIAAEATERPAKALRKREIDVALVTLRGDTEEGVTRTPLFEDEVVAVVPAAHSWTERPFVEAADFAGEHLLVFQTCTERNCVLGGVLAPAGVTPKKVTPVPLSTEAAIGMVAAGMGVTTMAQWAARPYLGREGLRAVPVTREGVRRTWHAATRSGEAAPEYLSAFVEVLGQTAFGAVRRWEENAAAGDGTAGDGVLRDVSGTQPALAEDAEVTEHVVGLTSNLARHCSEG